MKKWLMLICMLHLMLPLWAQQMKVCDYARQKKGILWGLLNKKKPTTDKKLAIIDLKTGEKGFTFKADGKMEVKAEEADGMLTLKVPHKTRYLVIQHPDYGQLTWKVPGKPLKKKKHYQAALKTYNPDKEYKLQKQWVVFKLEPQNAILYVDSTVALVRNGDAQFNLPLGKHTYAVESPFYEAMEDSLVLTDSARMVIPITLQPLYSYVTVRTPVENGDIMIDGKTIGQQYATSGHLQAGIHRLTVVRGHVCYYDQQIEVGVNEKKVIELTESDLTAQAVSDKQIATLLLPASTDSVAKTGPSELTAAIVPLMFAPVTIQAQTDSTEILVDKTVVGRGKWEGQLKEGFHAISSRKDGVESKLQYLFIQDDQPKIIRMMSPMAQYGVLNVHSNVVGADIYINDIKVGTTPMAVENLQEGKGYRIRLSKKGYHDGHKDKVEVIGNDMVDAFIEMKSEK